MEHTKTKMIFGSELLTDFFISTRIFNVAEVAFLEDFAQ